MRWNLGKAFILTLIFIVFGFMSANAQTGRCCYGDGTSPSCEDVTLATCIAHLYFLSWTEALDCTTPCVAREDSVQIRLEYPSPLWQYTNGTIDSTYEVEIWLNTNLSLSASSVVFEPMRNLFRIDSLVWGDTMLAAISDARLYSLSTIKNDTLEGSVTRTYASPSYFYTFPPTKAALRATTDFIKFATMHLTYKFDSLDVIQSDSISFSFDSSFAPPASEWLFTMPNGSSISPLFETDTIGLKYSKVDDIHPGLVPDVFELSQNYPNPFNPDTKIEFAISTKSFVNLTVYNIRGQKVRTLVDEELDVGWKSVTWDGKDDSGREVASGVYLYKVVAGDFVDSKKMIMLK